jgi:glyoxylase-like metal-dependent hydrolase (beta-lactamase superfamily II)/ketosteroid isomerase-like protein
MVEPSTEGVESVDVEAIAPRASRKSKAESEKVARAYFDAIDRHDLDAAVAMWAPGGREYVRGQIDATAPAGVRAFIGGLLAAMPDISMKVVRTTAEADRCAVEWRLTGTFAGPEPFNGIEPTGARIELEGCDVLTVHDGLLQANDAFTDSMTFARAIGMMPAQGSRAEQRMTGAFNVKTRLGRRLTNTEPRRVADGVWVLQGEPGHCNVYFLEEADGGVTMFDAGARTMTRAVASVGAHLGGIKRIVLGHGHTDHRGTAPALGVPVFCHPDDVADADGSGGWSYWDRSLKHLPVALRPVHRTLHDRAWDGGPVKISGTVREGDEVAGFRVIDLPGHSPGQIGLWRESDRLAIVSDCFYTLDMWGRDCPPHVPEAGYNYDTEQARASIRKLAEMRPAAAWAGHAKPLTGDVREQLLRAAESPA